MNPNVEYLKNELRNYNIIKYRYDNHISTVDNQIAYCKRRIKDIDTRLNAGNAKGIDYAYVPGNRIEEPLLVMLAEQEEYQNRLDELLVIKNQEIESYLHRIKYIDRCLYNLNEKWKLEFVMEHYINGKNIDDLNVGYSKSVLYENRGKILLEMLTPEKFR